MNTVSGLPHLSNVKRQVKAGLAYVGRNETKWFDNNGDLWYTEWVNAEKTKLKWTKVPI